MNRAEHREIYRELGVVVDRQHRGRTLVEGIESIAPALRDGLQIVLVIPAARIHYRFTRWTRASHEAGPILPD